MYHIIPSHDTRPCPPASVESAGSVCNEQLECVHMWCRCVLASVWLPSPSLPSHCPPSAWPMRRLRPASHDITSHFTCLYIFSTSRLSRPPMTQFNKTRCGAVPNGSMVAVVINIQTSIGRKELWLYRERGTGREERARKWTSMRFN